MIIKHKSTSKLLYFYISEIICFKFLTSPNLILYLLHCNCLFFSTVIVEHKMP